MFARLVPGAWYTATYPFGSQTFVASSLGTINFTDNQGCGALPPACDFTLAVANTNIGPCRNGTRPRRFRRPDTSVNPRSRTRSSEALPISSGIAGPNVGGAGVNVVQTNLFNVTGKIFVRASTTTSLTSTPNPSTVGQAVTLTATVRPVAPATGVPTGTVAFRDNGITIGSATLGATGSASFVTSALTTGSHPLTAVYSGSLDFLTSTSAVLTQTVNAVAPPPPAAGADTVTINLAQQVVGTGELRVEGVNGRRPAGGFAASNEIHDGAAAAGACPGALLGTVAVNAADGTWRFRNVIAARPTTVCVKSAGGGVSSRAVTQK